jgi:hypothetical protein
MSYCNIGEICGKVKRKVKGKWAGSRKQEARRRRQ